MANRFSPGNRDRNEQEICDYLDFVGIEYRKLSEGVGADLLLLVNPMRFVEIKNPKQPQSKRRLTKREAELLTLCEELGIKYDVIETVEEMNEIRNEILFEGVNRCSKP